MFENININDGEFVLLCGKTGSGKTTFLKFLLQQYKNRGISAGYVMQNFDAQIITDKVWHELSFGLENNGIDEKTMHRRVAEVCSYFGITDWLNRDTALLSGGQKQLLNLASVMALTPQILLLDEPVSQLDPVAAGNFLNTIKKLNRELGLTVVIAEHRLEELFDCADRVLFFEKKGTELDVKDYNLSADVCWNEEIENFLPVAARVALKTGEKKLPLSVKDGRLWLKNCVRDRSGAERCFEAFDSKQWRRKPEPRIARPDALVKIKNLTFKYSKNGPEVLSELNLEIYKGEILGIVGANGSGKSTLLKAVAGMKNKIKTVLLPQNVRNIFVHETVRIELEEAGWAGEPLNFVANELLERHPYDLSGGEMQKMALEIMMLKKPDLILLDEPTKGLDNCFKAELSDLLKKISSQGTAVVIVLHDLEFCQQTCDRAGVMFEGQVTGIDTPENFFSGNNFYTTALNRLTRGIVDGIVSEGQLVEILK